MRRGVLRFICGRRAARGLPDRAFPVLLPLCCACSSEADRPSRLGDLDGPARTVPAITGGYTRPSSQSGPLGAAPVDTQEFTCFPDLPEPELALLDLFRVDSMDSGVITYVEFSVVNWSDYPDELFRSTDTLGACGLNPAPSRTWVEFEDRAEAFIIGACDITGPEVLAGLGVELPGDYHAFRIRFVDRACQIDYVSMYVEL